MAEPPASRLSTVRHDSSRSAWRMTFLAPASPLAPYVRRFNAYAEHGTGFARRRELPSGLATLVFNLGPELRVRYPADAHSAFGAGAGFYAGLSSSYAVTETDGAQEGAQVMLTPLGACLLLGQPLRQVNDGLRDPSDLFGAAARRIAGRLLEARSQTQRLCILEQEMIRRVADADAPPRDLAWALRRLQASCGQIGIADLAAEIGCSRKHLSVRFRQQLGVTPKGLARLLRFDRVVQLLRRDQVTGWAELAARCGYADQAHLSREFRSFAGSGPAAFLGRRLPDEGGFVD